MLIFSTLLFTFVIMLFIHCLARWLTNIIVER